MYGTMTFLAKACLRFMFKKLKQAKNSSRIFIEIKRKEQKEPLVIMKIGKITPRL